MDTIDITLRLGLLVGGALGVNRHLRKQPSGLRTLSLVGRGSALAVMAVTNNGEINAISRIVQGVLTGVGFLGAGVIFRAGRRPGEHIHGLTTAGLRGGARATASFIRLWIRLCGTSQSYTNGPTCGTVSVITLLGFSISSFCKGSQE
jgi:MgtC family